jgi:hypothetical protein
MRTKLPSALVLGDTLATYDDAGRPLPSTYVLGVVEADEGYVLIATLAGPLPALADIPVELAQ